MTVVARVPREGAVEETSCAWPPREGRQTARKPAGGFIDCPVEYLTLPWWVYQQGAIALGTLRVWLGTLELVEKRCGAAPEVPAHYGPEELRRLLGWPRLAPVTAAVQQLEALGLLAWSPQAIQFLPHAEVLREALAQDGYQTLRAQVAPGLRWLPVPRRLLRWLAQEGQPGLIATACGVLLRCMRYKARQCVAGGRVAAPWIATVFGVAERTVQRAFTTLEACGWLARLAVQPTRERAHGRYTVINLAWQRPGVAETSRHTRTAAGAPEEPAMAACQHLSPLQGSACQNVSPIPKQTVSINTENTASCSEELAPALFQPFQEARLDPEPVGYGTSGPLQQPQQPQPPDKATSPPCLKDEDVSEGDYAAATARLLAQGTAPALLIRPVVLAEVQRARQEATPSPAIAAGQATERSVAFEATPAPAEPLFAPTPCSPARQTPQIPRAPVPACARTSTRTPPPTLRDVTRADLSDVDRLLALHQQAIARGWLRGGEAAQLTVVAAAVHARRVGQEPCRLFVALLRDQRWEVITQEDEDQALAQLRAHRDGSRQRVAAPTAMPEVPLSDDARFALRAPQVLRQAGWRGEPFLGVKLHDPTWTRERWEQAQAALAQWQRQQTQGRLQGSLDTIARPWEDREETEPDEDD